MCIGALALALGPLYASAARRLPSGTASQAGLHRVVVSTDIGGTDPDDFQSMVHLLLASDALDLEGLISSPFGDGRKQDILGVIDEYAKDFPNLRTHSRRYPTPERLRAITKQGAYDGLGYQAVGESTEGSRWLVERARAPDARPLHVLVWGGIDDLAQALHDAPDILPKLRVYFIGGPNKKWSVDAYQYIVQHHPDLWIIEANATYRGWFVGGEQAGEWGNTGFVQQHVAGHGALGQYFATHLQGTIKMGDSPSVGWLLHGEPSDPAGPGWGGAFVRAWDRPYVRHRRLTTPEDRIELFGVMEWVLPVSTRQPRPQAIMTIDNQQIPGYWDGQAMRFRCSPREAKVYQCDLRSDLSELDGRTARFTSVAPLADVAATPSARWPNWWTDDPAPHLAEGQHHGARTVSIWRRQILEDFARRLQRCAAPASAAGRA
ncbi:DUF1593 domain-containing protein [Xanthomonas campestris pv. parthenii]|nr:DUF1593 domain-containing protein [Xanthomonas campestris pv. parthenii]